jgi:hypothetical protein
MNLLYVKIGACVALLLGAFATGWHIRDIDFARFKEQVAVVAKAQEAHVESVKKQQDLVTKGIKNDFENKLAAVRNYYSGVQFNSSSRSVPGISAAPKGTDAETAYPVLAGQCAATTAQLTSLQDWVNAQVGIK